MPKTMRKSYMLKQSEFDDEQGSFSAVFATLNQIDLDGDVTLPGAFGEQRVIISAYGHGSWGGGLPVGKGRIYERGEQAIVEGQFFLDTEMGRETYKTVKNVNELQEWSYALPEVESHLGEFQGEDVRFLEKIRVNEVSPVLMGSGIGTRLLSIKSANNLSQGALKELSKLAQRLGVTFVNGDIREISSLKRAFGSHSTATDDRAWDAGANEKRVRKDEPRSYYAKIYAYYDPDGEVGNKSTYKFIHHFVAEGGAPGAASTRACSNGIAILNGARGGTNIPDADRQGVWRHLAKHLRDADMEPPELRSLDANGKRMPLRDHIEVLLADAAEVIERLEEVSEQRAEQDRHPSESTIKRMALIKSVLADLVGRLEQVQSKHDDLFKEFLRFQKIIAERRDRDASCKVS